ncbi:xaa-Pro aminopeptidase ApepP [Musca vetustissima]|uniref:xaa-Pro aminopeptidase ApepP n=1 Tax=Musca vetustissima TaxID=27455 RepID=UPI002AB75DE5|nr:xaa-Pro aminopeptidase ApepP [Musca vetustissima]
MRIIMKDTTEILKKLRQLMQTHGPSPLAAYIVPSDDAHQSEYICQHDERRAFVSGFDGSAGTAVITGDKALLWTDGRYYQQAQKQLDSNWELMKDGLPTTPSVASWLACNLAKGSRVGVDPKLFSYRLWKPIEKELSGAECSLIPVEDNLVDIVWGDEQPKQTSNPIITLDTTFAGMTVSDKWANVKEKLTEKKAQALVVSALDEIAWFLNLRGSDIDYNPVFFSYLIITHEQLMFFVDSSKLPSDFKQHQASNGVEISLYSYSAIGEELGRLAENNAEAKIWISPGSSYYLNALIPKKIRHQEITPIALAKAIKNPIEVEGFINSHIRDGVALCQYFAWLEQMIANKQPVDEISGATKLEEFRSKKEHFMGLSFPTISSSGPNGSVIHYHPAPETNRPINDKEIYLCDSGAQYRDGTTDVTRTWHFGEPTDFQMETYTRVLKGQLTLGATIFPKKVKGQVLDTLARKALWDVGLDYGHGTGHGVGHFLNVHEGPMGVGIRLMPDDPGLQENMFISNEPGYYQDGEFGIRIEDIVQIVPASSKYDFNGRGALTFKTITMAPKQTKMIKKELLLPEEKKLLNDYHRLVWETLSPILKKEGDTLTLAWLERETKEI